MTGRRSVLEKQRQREIEAAIGAEPDLLLLKNSVGVAKFFDDDGKQFVVPYGLGVGSPDLVGVLRVSVSKPEPAVGVWFCLEVKADEGELSPEQLKSHEIWRRFGAIVETVRSADEARAALERARNAFRRHDASEKQSLPSNAANLATRPLKSMRVRRARIAAKVPQ